MNIPFIDIIKIPISNVIMGFLCYWSFSDLSGNNLSFSNLLELKSTYALIFYLLCVTIVSALHVMKRQDEIRKQKLQGEILEVAVGRAKRSLELNEAAILASIDTLFIMRKDV